jgi:hypothetical protein
MLENKEMVAACAPIGASNNAGTMSFRTSEAIFMDQPPLPVIVRVNVPAGSDFSFATQKLQHKSFQL